MEKPLGCGRMGWGAAGEPLADLSHRPQACRPQSVRDWARQACGAGTGTCSSLGCLHQPAPWPALDSPGRTEKRTTSGSWWDLPRHQIHKIVCTQMWTCETKLFFPFYKTIFSCFFIFIIHTTHWPSIRIGTARVLNLIYLCVYVHTRTSAQVCMHVPQHVCEVWGQPVTAGSLLPPCGCKASSS